MTEYLLRLLTAPLPSGEAAHKTGLSEEPKEADETNKGEHSGGIQKELEEVRSTSRRRVLVEITLVRGSSV